jgi:C4-dicarboxylate-specific signal transduction histidine kinase
VVHADLVQLQQVMLNLVVNAVDAMRDQPLAQRVLSISVTAHPQEGALFQFKDAGPGVPPEMNEKIFDALFSTKRDGLGMGLAISRSIIENHGGRLRLETAGAGANFVFNIRISQ